MAVCSRAFHTPSIPDKPLAATLIASVNQLATSFAGVMRMNDGPETDLIKPWTIKAIAVAARDEAIHAARLDGVAVGIWLERVIRQARSKQVVNLSTEVSIETLMQIATHAGLPRYVRSGAARLIADRLAIVPPHLRLRAESAQGPNQEQLEDDSDAGIARQGGGADRCEGGPQVVSVADCGGQLAEGGGHQEGLAATDPEGQEAPSDDAGPAGGDAQITAAVPP